MRASLLLGKTFCSLLLTTPPGSSLSAVLPSFKSTSFFLCRMSSPATRTRFRAKLLQPMTTISATFEDGHSTPAPPPKRRKRVVTPEAPPSSGLISTSATPTTNNFISDDGFQDLKVPPEELRPSATLTTGQCFNWKAITQLESKNEQQETPTSAWGTHNATEFLGTLRTPNGESVVLVIRETPATTLFRVLHAPKSDLDVEAFLLEYFQLNQPLATLYKEWSKQDRRLGRIAQCIPGVRIVNQDPWECLISFICSSNNNIPRITKILSAIRREYGTPLLKGGGEHDLVEETIHSFPSLQELQKQATDADLRNKCGLGYRAKYILETMKILDSLGGEAYLHDLKEKSSIRTLSPLEVQEALIQFCGVGRKVADCVALFSLKQCGAIPVDVHVWNIACRDYDDEGLLKSVKSLTPTVYNRVGDLFRTRFPQKAGWAHSLLFIAELPSFRPVLPSDMIDEMDKFRAEEQARKKAGKK